MLPFILGAGVLQPIAVQNFPEHTSLTRQAAQIDATTDMPRIGDARASYISLANQARASGDAPLANAPKAKAAYAEVIEGNYAAARMALISVIKDSDSAPPTRMFATSLPAYINQPNRDLDHKSRGAAGTGFVGFAHGINGVIQHF